MSLAPVLNQLHDYSKQHPAITCMSIASTLVTPLQDLLLPYLTGNIVDAIHRRDKGAMHSAILSIGISILLIQIAYVGVDIIDAKLFPSLQQFIRQSMLSCILEKNENDYSSELHVGDIISKLVKTPVHLSSWFEALKGMIPNLIVFIVSTAYFWSIDKWLGVMLLIAAILSFTSVIYNIRNCSEISTARDQSLNLVHEQIDDLLHNMPTVYASGTKADEILQIAENESVYLDLFYKTIMCATKVKMWMVPVVILLVAGVLWHCNSLLHSGRLTVGRFVSVFTVVLYIMSSMVRIVAHSRTMVYYWGTIQSSIDMLCCSKKRDVRDARDARDAIDVRMHHYSPMHPLLSLDRVSYSPHKLNGVSFQIRFGDRVALVGSMGAGKTTILKLVMQLIKPTSGALYWEGVPYSSMSNAQIRSHFGYIPQQAPLFNRTMLENVLYGTEGLTEQDAELMAKELGLDHVFRNLPGGFSMEVGKAGSKLSGGQRQAAWILRMALNRPDVLVLDEATASMDSTHQELVADAINKFPTVIIVSHDTNFIKKVATRIIRVVGGRVGGTNPYSDN